MDVVKRGMNGMTDPTVIYTVLVTYEIRDNHEHFATSGYPPDGLDLDVVQLRGIIRELDGLADDLWEVHDETMREEDGPNA